jgi:hypothetical protein
MIELKGKKNFNKNTTGKIRNLEKWGSKWKIKHMRNCNWMTKLKIIKTSINKKGTRWKINRMKAKIEK